MPRGEHRSDKDLQEIGLVKKGSHGNTRGVGVDTPDGKIYIPVTPVIITDYQQDGIPEVKTIFRPTPEGRRRLGRKG